MARKSQADVDKARSYLLETIGIKPADVKAWTKARKAKSEHERDAQDHYHKQQQAIRAARFAKSKATGEDYPELTNDEYKAALAPVPPPKYSDEQRTKVRDRHYALEKRLANVRRVYVIARHVAPSGMSRRLSLHVIRDGCVLQLTYNAATLLGQRYNDRDGSIVIGGCGMDMGFALVSELSEALFGDAYLLKKEWL